MNKSIEQRLLEHLDLKSAETNAKLTTICSYLERINDQFDELLEVLDEDDNQAAHDYFNRGELIPYKKDI